MTEAEWLASIDPQPMLTFLRGKVSDRKLRLFAVACCRNVWYLLTDKVTCKRCHGRSWVTHPESGLGTHCYDCQRTGQINRSRKSIEAAEQYADNQITKEELAAAEAAGWNAWDVSPPGDCARFAWAAAWSSAEIAWVAARQARIGVLKKERDLLLLGDIFGNLFRPVVIDPAWLTWHGGSVVSMAQRMYDSRDFAAMPILADALEDAGCTNEEILNHCRESGEHVRGCWVVDLLLGKE